MHPTARTFYGANFVSSLSHCGSCKSCSLFWALAPGTGGRSLTGRQQAALPPPGQPHKHGGARKTRAPHTGTPPGTHRSSRPTGLQASRAKQSRRGSQASPLLSGSHHPCRDLLRAARSRGRFQRENPQSREGKVPGGAASSWAEPALRS